MALGKRLINTGGAAACLTETTDIFGDSSGVALYSLDYDASDESGLYDGTPTNVDFGVDGQINYGARFNGSSSAIQISSTSTVPVNISAGTFSISMWINMDNLTNNNKLVYKWGATAANRNFLFTVLNSSGYLYFVEGTTGGDVLRTGTFALSTNTWHHIVLTREQGGSLKMYVDGDLKDTFTATGIFKTSTEPIYLGYQVGQTTNFDGSIDQVRIFSKALSSDEVSTLYAETACVHTSTTDIVNYPTGTTPVAYYKLDNSSEDYSTGGNDGTDTNIEYRFGRFGQAAVFNGSSSNIAISGSIINSLTSITYSVWVYYKGDVASQSYGHIIGGGGTSLGTGNAIALAVQTSNDYLYAYSPSETSFTTTALPRNTWTHLALTNNGSTTTIYMNGNSVHTASQSLSTNSSGNAFRIGEYFYNGNYHFYGSIDQVRIYDAALTSSQVTELYNEKPEVDTSNFKTVLYEGNGNDNRYISNLGIDLETDGGLVWTKARTAAYYHQLQDSVREAGANALYSNSIDAENGGGSTYNTDFGYINSFEANGWFTKNGSDGLGTWVNKSGENYVAWVWKGGGDAVPNTDGSITSQVSANTDAGFSIVKFDGYQSSGTTVGHGLNSTPELIIVKNLDQTTSWPVWFDDAITMTSTTFTLENSTKYLALNSTTGYIPFTLDKQFGGTLNGGSADEMIAYCFHSVSGYSKIGSYTGTGAAGNQVNVGFRPRFLMVKRTDASGGWGIVDSLRSQELYPHLNYAETVNSRLIINDDGFVTTDSSFNESGSANNFIYLAIK